MNGLYMTIALLILAANLFSFALMGWDKRCARKGKWRVPEKRLFLAAGCFGALGGLLGMYVYRHKTKHWYFRIFFPLMLVAQVAILVLAARLI